VNENIKAFPAKYKIEFVVAGLAAVLFMLAWYRESMLVLFDKISFGWLMAVLTAAVFLVARISYPKIYKFKMLLSGYALMAVVICYLIIEWKFTKGLRFGVFNLNFYDKATVLSDKFAYKYLLTILNICLLSVMLANSYVNYNTGKMVAWISFGVIVIFYLGTLMALTGRGGRFVYDFNKMQAWINPVIAGLTIVFSLFNVEEEHNYGSIVVAMTIITLYCLIQINYVGQMKLLFPVMMIIIIWGMFAHWVNCLHHRAHYDPLLKIYNRQYMDNIIHGIADIKLGKKIGVMMCDIDHFKKVNDTYGHAAGDAVLFRIAQIIRDTALPEGVVCRYGGEEIIVFLRDKTGDDADAKGEKIRKAVKAASVKYKSKNIKVTMSIGVASTSEGLGSMEKTIKKADDCVYKAKKTGRDKVVSD
jgi:diguanylate cyclase (GGDEF)-like protein